MFDAHSIAILPRYAHSTTYVTALGHTSVRCASGCAVECRICNWEVAGSNLGRGYFAPRSLVKVKVSGVGK